MKIFNLKIVDRAFNILADMGLGFANLMLILHLAIVYTKLIHHLNPDKSYMWLDLSFAILISLAYSVATVIIIRQARNLYVKILFSVFDTIGVFMYYNVNIYLANPDVWVVYLSAFFATFTGLIIFSLGYISLQKKKDDEKNPYQELKNLQEGMKEEKQKQKQLQEKLAEQASETKQLRRQSLEYERLNILKGKRHGKLPEAKQKRVNEITQILENLK